MTYLSYLTYLLVLQIVSRLLWSMCDWLVSTLQRWYCIGQIGTAWLCIDYICICTNLALRLIWQCPNLHWYPLCCGSLYIGLFYIHAKHAVSLIFHLPTLHWPILHSWHFYLEGYFTLAHFALVNFVFMSSSQWCSFCAGSFCIGHLYIDIRITWVTFLQ